MISAALRRLRLSMLFLSLSAAAYGDDVSVEKLGALYGVGVAKARAFIDGNKRIAFAVMVACLRAHGRG